MTIPSNAVIHCLKCGSESSDNELTTYSDKYGVGLGHCADCGQFGFMTFRIPKQENKQENK